MRTPDKLLDVCAMLALTVLEDGTKQARARIEFGDKYDGYCFDVTFREMTPEELSESGEVDKDV